MTTLDIRAPEDQTEGTRSQILRWLKGIGETVAEHEPLIEIETDKVTVEVASPASGVLREIVKGEQDEIAPGEVLGRLEAASSAMTGATNSERAAGREASAEIDAASAPVEAAATAQMDSDISAQTDADVGARRDAAPLSTAAPISHDPVATQKRAARSGTREATLREERAPASPNAALLSPAVRRLLAERGLDAATVRGSGEGGRITVDDVLAHAPAIPPLHKESPHAADSLPSATAKSRVVPHSAVRKRIAQHMVQSLLQTAPHVTTVFEADLSAVMAHRAARRASFEAQRVPLTYTAYFLAAVVQAIRAVPETNSRWTDSALEIYDDIHIGVATAVEGTGLIVPVLRHAESRDLADMARELDRLVTGARDGALSPADMRGGTFTISNHGVSGSLLATPIVINQPQSAILGIGKVEKRPVVLEGGDKVVARPKCYVTLTIDHRVMDGHQANRFLQTFVRTLETWPSQ